MEQGDVHLPVCAPAQGAETQLLASMATIIYRIIVVS